jgi:hypothetical protein
MARFRITIKNSAQLLQSPNGDQVPQLLFTRVDQRQREPGQCQFEAIVNMKGNSDGLTYDPEKQELRMPGGELLPVEILSFKPYADEFYGEITAKCKVEFPYDTVNYGT